MVYLLPWCHRILFGYLLKGLNPVLRKLLIILTCIFVLTVPHDLHACGVCIERPDASLADHIISAEIIVLAGPAPGNPFRFETHRIIKGGWDRLNALPDIPFLIDSVTRRAIRSDPSRSVLMTYGPAYKDSTGRSASKSWRRIFLMNPDRREFVEKLRSTGEHWVYGTTDTHDRVLFFAEYLWHPDHALHTAAMIEIGRAPYDLLRPISGRFSTRQVLQEFNDLNRFAYRSVAIRLLGLQADPLARSFVRARYANSLKSGGSNSLEWALAGIEADEATAISAIGQALQNTQRSEDDKISLIRALAEAGSSQAKFRTQIIQILAEVLEQDPELAPQIAIATRNWGKTALHQQFEALVALEETDLATQFVLNMVLGEDVPSD